MNLPEQLKRGDTLAIIAPAKAIEQEYIDFAVDLWENQGFKVVIGKHCLGQHHYFSGTDTQRAHDLQAAIDNENVKAIICARGGYGCVRLIDRINWAGLINQPKWLVGFSDVTVFHHHLATLELPSIHATMPLNYKENTPESLASLVHSLTGPDNQYTWDSKSYFKSGEAEGEVLGGNLAVIANMVGTRLMPDYRDKILFIEDVGEHLYAIDRMFYQLDKSGILDNIAGLIVGSFTGMKDTEVPFGQSLEEIILSHVKYRKIPVGFLFPAGHQDDNRAITFGIPMKFTVDDIGSASLSTNKSF